MAGEAAYYTQGVKNYKNKDPNTRERESKERPKRGQREAKERPKRGQREAKERPKRGQREARERPKRGQREARERTERGQREDRERTERGQRGQSEDKARTKRGQSEAKARPVFDPSDFLLDVIKRSRCRDQNVERLATLRKRERSSDELGAMSVVSGIPHLDANPTRTPWQLLGPCGAFKRPFQEVARVHVPIGRVENRCHSAK